MPASPPPYAQPLLGRDALLEALATAIQTPGRITSLVGPGGIGKTRIAAALATAASGIFVPLGAVSRTDDVPEAIASVLALRDLADPEARVLEALPDGAVVLDQVAHLPGIAVLLTRWVSMRPRISWVVTSRRPLGGTAEVVVAVPPLPLPETDALSGSAAATLLQDAAPRPLDLAADPEATVAVLRLTGGIPLAIELAAARLALLPIDALRERIDQRYFATLRDPGRPERGLEVILDDAWDRLDPEVRPILAEISVFAGPFLLDGAEAVLSAGADVLDPLQQLHAVHLLRVVDGRMHVLEPVRRYARRQLDAMGAQRTLRRHAAWVTTVAHDHVTQIKREPDRIDALAALAPELRSVLARAEGGQLDIESGTWAAHALINLLLFRGSETAMHRLGERALALGIPSTVPGRRMWAQICTLYAQRLEAEGRPEALAVAQQVLDHSQGLPEMEQCNLLIQLAGVRHGDGDLIGARQALERAVEISGGGEATPWALADLALVAHDQGCAEEAEGMLQDAHDQARRTHDRRAEGRVVEVRTTIAVELRDRVAGTRWNDAFRALSEAFGNQRKVGLSNLFAAILLEIEGDGVGARAICGIGREQLVGIDAHKLVALADGLLGRIALGLGDLDVAADLLPAWREAWTSTQTEADTYAAVLAAHRVDPDEARRKASVVPASALAAVAVTAASCLAADLDAPPPAEALSSLRPACAAIPCPIDARLGQALVDRATARWHGWVVAHDGTWVRTPEGDRLDLSRSRANAAMLGALAMARGAGPAPMDLAALATAVWPGERMVDKAARTRVHVALSGLRKAGLRRLIRHDPGGWCLDPDQPVHVEMPRGG